MSPRFTTIDESLDGLFNGFLEAVADTDAVEYRVEIDSADLGSAHSHIGIHPHVLDIEVERPVLG